MNFERGTLDWRIFIAMSLVATGCRAPAAHVSALDATSCRCTLARQLVEDSVVEMASHPMRTGQELVVAPCRRICRVGQGAFGKRLAMKFMREPPPVEDDPFTPFESEAVADSADPNALQSAHVDLYPNGSAALSALEQLIAAAKSRIDVLMFQWEDDDLGRRLARQLADRARSGVHVRILLDGGGNLVFGHETGSLNAVVAELAQVPNVSALRIRDPFGRFDHRKLVVIDGQVAWSGGRNFTQEAFYQDRDLSYVLRGPLVADLVHDFKDHWEDQGGAVEESETPAETEEPAKPPEIADKAALQHVAFKERAHGFLANARGRLIHTGPCDHQIEGSLYAAVDGAQHRIYLENYTFCDSLLVYKLAQARQRGVDVRIVTTLSNVTPTLNRANRVIINRLIASGVRVYIHPAMTHVKAAAVDGRWAYIGSGNFDPLSLRRNYELALTVTAGPVVDELERVLFQVDFQPAWEVKQPLPTTFGDYACEILASLCL